MRDPDPRRVVGLARAQRIVCSDPSVVGSESLDLADCLGRILRKDIVSRSMYPQADSAARDGYCVPAASTKGASAALPVVLALKGTVRPGERPGFRIGRGECVRIMTGGLLAGAGDAVVPVEEVEAGADYVEIRRPVEAGTHVRSAGEVVRAGATVGRKGDVLRPGLLGLLAALGVKKARVSRPVRMAVIVTGSEIVSRGLRPHAWQVNDSNSLMLSGLGRELSWEVTPIGVARDSDSEIARRLRSAGDCDMVILTGGSGRGISDLVPAVLERHGCRILLRGLRMRPGNHVVFARKGRRAFFALPGRPGGCFGLFHLLVKPAMMAMMGSTKPIPAPLKGFWVGWPIPAPAVDTLIAVSRGPGSEVRPVNRAGCLGLDSVARANCLALLRAGQGRVVKGDALEVFPV